MTDETITVLKLIAIASLVSELWLTTDRQTGRQTDRQTGRQADGQADRQTYRQTDR